MSSALLQQFAAGASTVCQNTSDVCLRNLPQSTTADGSTVQTVLQIVIGVIAAVAVLFIAIGGLRYILSQGDPQGVSKAKATILYALIGLAVAIMAQVIVLVVVRFVS